MIIQLPDDVFQLVAEAAKKRGTTPDVLAISLLREALVQRGFPRGGPPRNSEEVEPQYANLAERLAPYIGKFKGDGKSYAENSGREFADLLEEKHRKETEGR